MKKRMWQRSLSLLLALLLALGNGPVYAFAQEETEPPAMQEETLPATEETQTTEETQATEDIQAAEESQAPEETQPETGSVEDIPQPASLTDDTADIFRWENTGSDFVSTHGGNALTKTSGTIADGVLNEVQFQLETPVVLLHTRPWALEWKASGSWSGMLLAQEAESAATGNTFLFKTRTDSGLIAFGEKTADTYHNYGIALTERGINVDLAHTYRIENRIASDGSNMAYLLVDGTDLGPMNRFFVGGSSDQGTNVDWLNGRDLTFSYIGTSGHSMDGCALAYLTVWEGEHSHSFTDGTCTQCGERQSILPEGWNPVPVSANMTSKHLGYQIQDGVLTFHDFAQPGTVGYGALPDYTNSSDVLSRYDITPWYQERSGITQVIFDETVSYIGAYTLTNMDGLTQIHIENPQAKVAVNAVLFSTTARETPLEIYAHSTLQTADSWIRGNSYRKISEAIGEVTLFYTDLAHLAPELSQLEENLEDPQALYDALKLAGNIPQKTYSVSDYRCAIPGAESALELLWSLSSGSCGENVTYRLEAMEQEGKLNLIISGTGDLTVYPTTASQPWYPVQDCISDVTIADTVTGLYSGVLPLGATYHLCLNSDGYRWAKENDLSVQLDKLRILCIGNSHTADYSEFLESILKDLKNAGLETDVQITRSVIGSIGLYSGRNSNANATHRSRMESLAAKAGAYSYLKNNRYDLVIVQDYMESVVDAPEVFLPGLASYIGAVKQLASDSGKGAPQVAWFADWVDIRATGGDTALYDGQGSKIQLPTATRAEVYARSLKNITAVQEAISQGTANMPDFVIQGSTLKQNAMSSYLGTSRMFDKNAYCILERDTTHLTYELGRYLFGAGVLAKIVDHYRDMLAFSGRLDVGDALTLTNGPVASGTGTQYSGTMTEELLAVIRDVISSPDSFRQSAYTLDPAQEIMDQLLGVTWKLGEGETQESVLSAIQSQVQALLIDDADKVTVTLANYVSPREFDLRFRVSHGYTVLEQTDTGHRCQYTSTLFAPTATKQGYTAYTCTTCGYSYTDNTVPARGYDHMLEDGEFKLLLIGNSFSEDASNSGQGMTTSQLLDILQAMLGDNVKVTVGRASHGGRSMAWHATQAERGSANHALGTIVTGETWKSHGFVTLENALTWTNWDAISIQPYGEEAQIGVSKAIVPDEEDEKFYPLSVSAPFLLDFFHKHAPQAEIYYYMIWARSYAAELNASKANFERYDAQFAPTAMTFRGTESGARFTDIIPVGTAIQNARSTYLSLLQYNTTETADKLTIDTQIGLQRDNGHLTLNVGRYLAALTFAETILPQQLRASGYRVPDIRITESVGQLPKEYTVLVQKSVAAAVEGWQERQSLLTTTIAGYEEDPTVAASEKLTALSVPCAMDLAQLQEKIGKAALDILGTDFAVDKVTLPEDFSFTGENQEVTATVTFRFGYTGVTKDVTVSIGAHSYQDVVTKPTCTEQGYTTHTCAICGDSYVDGDMDALGHSYGNWQKYSEPFAAEYGENRRYCASCEAYESQKILPLGHVSATADTLAAGETLTLMKNNIVMINKDMYFRCELDSLEGGLIRMGHGKTAYTSQYIEITETHLNVWYYYTADSNHCYSYAHGLEITDWLEVTIHKEKGNATITIATEGGSLSGKYDWRAGANGPIFCEVEGVDLRNVDCRWWCQDFDADYWFFGDSWFSSSSSARWTSYMLNDGHTDVLLAAYGGMGAPVGAAQFEEFLKYDTPKYAIWCLGMNNGDYNGKLSTTWLPNTEKFLALCEEHGVTPILATIPTTPKVNNRLKNAWVEASGYRYIDFDLALVQNHVTGEWYEGTAASDLNHPTTAGAQLLYPQLHADFPELAEGNREGCTHKLAYLQAKQPECVDGGRNAYYVCTLCAAAFLDEGATQSTTTAQMLLPPAGHSYDEGTVTKEATEETEGQILYTCTVCAVKKTEVLPKLPHTHKWLDGNAVIKECISCGHVEGGYRIEAPAQEVWIDGVKQKIYTNSTGTFLQLEHTDARTLTVYTYNDASAPDPHTQYPTTMQVWLLTFENGAYTAQHVRELDNLLGYAGASIRVKGIKGIRILTSLDKALRSKLMDGSLGYRLQEYGTCAAWASDMNGAAPVLTDGKTMYNYAYQKNVADLIFEDTGSTIQYTNVLVGFTDDQLAKDLVMRPYIILENAQGQQITLYGGCITRSIGYVAKQNQNTFPEGSKADAYIEAIISKVYG